MAFSGTPSAYKDACATFLRILCNDKDMERARTYLAEDCTLIHEDFEPVHSADTFIKMWSKNLVHMPDYHKVIVDIVCELEEGSEKGAVLWVYSRISGIHGKDGKWTDSIDMMKFNAEGKFFYSKDVQRAIARTDTQLSVKTPWGASYARLLKSQQMLPR